MELLSAILNLLADSDKIKKDISFYWTSGQAGNPPPATKVRCTLTINGSPYVVEADLLVHQPASNATADFSGGLGDVRLFPSTNPTVLGLLALDPSQLDGINYGITWRASVTVPAGWDQQSTFVYAQKIKVSRNVTGEEPYKDANSNGQKDAGETYTDLNGNGQWDSGGVRQKHRNNGVWALDGEFPFGVASGEYAFIVNQSPEVGDYGDYPKEALKGMTRVGTGRTMAIVPEQFETWLMFRPSAPGSNYVPLKKFTWQWQGEATKSGSTWTLANKNKSNSSFVVTDEHPIWSLLTVPEETILDP